MGGFDVLCHFLYKVNKSDMSRLSSAFKYTIGSYIPHLIKQLVGIYRIHQVIFLKVHVTSYYIKYWNNRSLLMGMNGIIFEYMNEYGCHADLIYQWLFCHAPATPPHPMLS